MGKKKHHHPNYEEMATIENKFNNKNDHRSYNSGRKTKIKCRNENQKRFLRMIETNDIILCSGPAGCGKSHLSLVKALDLIQQENNNFHKLCIITPAIEVGAKLGFLPGNMDEKLLPYIMSSFSLIDKTIGKKQRDQMVENGDIEILNAGYIRGMNLDNTILICEETQNFSKKELLTILTRIGENAKIIASGDVMQIDAFNRDEDSGLYHAINNLKNIRDIGIMEFTDEDIVRHPIISVILERY